MNYIIWLSYDGTRYDGWQKQGNTEKTIQGKLERILEKLDGEPVEVRGSGRTDAGVHAQGQVADFRLKGKRTPDEGGKNECPMSSLRNVCGRDRDHVSVLRFSR